MTRYCDDYRKIEEAIAFIETRFREQPGLADVADAVGVSPEYFQKIFSRWAGISPKRFLQHVTLAHAKPLLADACSILDATLELGLSSPARLHDLFVVCEAVTPGEYKRRGQGLTIRYGLHDTLFGTALLAISEKGICELDYPADGTRAFADAVVSRKWPGATLIYDEAHTRPYIDAVFAPLHGNPAHRRPLSLHLKGTNFQMKVWEALLRIPSGRLVSYEDIARSVGNPRAVRAVGSAVGDNPIAYLIPCHRVLRKSGAIGGYATGTPRKRAMLALETLQTDLPHDGSPLATAG